MAACLGLVLAGGRSRRMGSNKAFAALAGTTLVDHAMARLGPQCAALALSASRDAEGFARLGVPVLADALPDFAGPLAGILAGLDRIAAARPDLDGLVCVAVDTPFVPDDLARRLRAAADAAGTDVACAASGGRRHPVAAFWRAGTAARLRAATVTGGERRVSAVLDRLGCAEAEWPVRPFDPFFNVNTPADLEAAEAAIRDGRITPSG